MCIRDSPTHAWLLDFKKIKAFPSLSSIRCVFLLSKKIEKIHETTPLVFERRESFVQRVAQMSQFARSSTSKYKFGAHISSAGGISNSVTNAYNVGCNSFAMFLKSPRKWVSPPYPDDEVQKFKTKCKDLGYDPKTDILPHGSYFINLANPDPEKAEKSYGGFIDDLHLSLIHI